MTDATEKTEQAEQSEQPAVSPKRRTIGEHLAVVTAIWLVIASILEWGYWHGFGVSYAEIPVSARFLLHAALVWAPVLLIAALLYMAYEVVAVKFLGFQVGDDMLPPFYWPSEPMRKINMFCGFFVGMFLYQLVFTKDVNFVLIYILWSYAAYYFLRYVFNHTVFSTFKNTRIRVCLALFCSTPLLYCLGFYMSIHDSADADKMAVVEYKEEFSIAEKNALVLRNNSDSIIAFSPHSRRLLVIPLDAVLGVSYASNPGWNVNLLGKSDEPEKKEKE